MRLAGLVGDVGLDHEVIVHRAVLHRLWNREGHHDLESAVVGRHGLALAEVFILQSAAVIARLPIPRVRHPPEGHAAAHLVAHLGALHGHAGIAQCPTLGAHGVAGLISPVVGGKLHMERRALVLLDADGGTALIAGADGKSAVQQALGQRKPDAALAVAVGHGLLFGYQLIVGIAQFKLEGLVGHGLIVEGRHLAPHDGCHRDRLARTVDAAVGKQGGVHATVVVITETVATVAVRRRAIAVGRCRGKHAGGLFVVFDTIDNLALAVGRQALEGLGLTPPVAEPQPERDTSGGLAARGVDHHIADAAVRLVLHDDAQVGDV